MRIELQVYRTKETARSVTGQMWLQGMRWFYTVEPARVNPVHVGHPCIPAGRYQAQITRSPHLGYYCPELLAVPGRSDIRIHAANFPEQLLGCTGVGEVQAQDAVYDSRPALQRMMMVLRSYEDIFVTYVDGPPPEKEETNGDRTILYASGAPAPPPGVAS